MRIGFFGGTFDPVHNGHVAMARAALAGDQLDKLVVVPAGRTVHKQVADISFAGIRYTLCRLAFRNLPDVDILKNEARRPVGAYTVDTIRELKQELNPDDTLYMVCGADILFDIDGWREPETILREADVLASLRPGHDIDALRARAEELNDQYGASISFFEAEQVDVSSTGVRKAVAAGQEISDMVPAPVARFISSTGLYASDDPLAELTQEQRDHLRDCDRILLDQLDGGRLRHSIHTMMLAAQLARVHGVDVYKAALGGLLHDCAKNIPVDEAKKSVAPNDPDTLAAAALYHGPAGGDVAQNLFGIDDPEVLDAVRYHSTGHANMTPLDLVVYLADKLEPARRYPGVAELRTQAWSHLGRAFLASTDWHIGYLRSRGLLPHRDTLAARESIERSLLT